MIKLKKLIQIIGYYNHNNYYNYNNNYNKFVFKLFIRQKPYIPCRLQL